MQADWEFADTELFLTEQNKSAIKALPASMFEPKHRLVRNSKRLQANKAVDGNLQLYELGPSGWVPA